MQGIERLKPGGKLNGLFLTALFLVIAVAPVGAVSNDYTEEFTGTSHRDAVNTTANWNTTAPSALGTGRLELWRYDAESASGNGYGVACDGDLVALCDGTSGVRFYDGSAPQTLGLLSTFNTSGNARDCVILGTKCYVADGQSGYVCLDITDPSAPFEYAHLNRVQIGGPAGGHSYGIDADGTYAYVADGTRGLVIVDAVALFPTGPAGSGGDLDTPGTATDVKVVEISGDKYAFISDGSKGLRIVRVTFPGAPAFQGTLDTPGYAEDVVVRQVGPNLLAFVADGTLGLQIINVDNLNAPVLVSNFRHGTGTNTPTVFFGGAGTGTYAYGVTVEQQGPTLVAYLADDQGVVAVNVTNPGTPTFMGAQANATPSPSGGSRCVAVCGSVGWTATNAFGVEGFDATDILNRYVVGDNVGQSNALDALPDVIYKARVTRHFPVSADSENVALELSSNGGTNFQSYTALPPVLNGNWATIATPGSNLVFKETLSKNPSSGASPDPGSDRLKFEWLYNFGVIESVVDIAGDKQLRLTWTRSAKDFSAESPQITEYAIYRRIDSAPALIGFDSVTPNPELAVAGWDFITNVPATSEDVYSTVVPTLADAPTYSVFFIRARTALPETYYDSYPDSGQSVNNAPQQQVWSSANTPAVVEARNVPISFALHRSSPNPFRGIALIRYDVPGAGADVKLGVYDITGRLVRLLVDGAQSAGQKSVAWDGRDHSGRAVAPGMYLLRMQAPGFSGMQKMLLTQ